MYFIIVDNHPNIIVFVFIVKFNINSWLNESHFGNIVFTKIIVISKLKFVILVMIIFVLLSILNVPNKKHISMITMICNHCKKILIFAYDCLFRFWYFRDIQMFEGLYIISNFLELM